MHYISGILLHITDSMLHILQSTSTSYASQNGNQKMNKCIVPNCDYNYDSERKKRKLRTEYEKISIFAFPKHEENPANGRNG